MTNNLTLEDPYDEFKLREITKGSPVRALFRPWHQDLGGMY